MRIRLDFFAQPRDEDFDGSAIVLVIAMPNPFAKLGAGKGAARLLHEDLQNIKFTRRERDRPAVACYQAAMQVQVQVADLQDVRRVRSGRAPTERLDAGDQFVHGEGLGQVIVRTGF